MSFDIGTLITNTGISGLVVYLVLNMLNSYLKMAFDDRMQKVDMQHSEIISQLEKSARIQNRIIEKLEEIKKWE